MLNTQKIRQDFPILKRLVNGQPITYLDSAATSQKPNAVINALLDFYHHHNAPVNRDGYQLSRESSSLLEESRIVIANFFGAKPSELILTTNSSQAIQLLASTWGKRNIREKDEILVSALDYQGNVNIWHDLTREVGARIDWIRVDELGQIDLEDLKYKLNHLPVKLLVLTHVSNTLGTITPIKKICRLVKEINPEVKVLVDGAQASSHLPIDFDQFLCDFYVFSGHKMLGPIGTGGLLVKESIFQSAQIDRQIMGSHLNSVVDNYGLMQACDYLSHLGRDAIYKHNQDLIDYATNKLREIPEIKILARNSKVEDVQRVALLSLSIEGVDISDLKSFMDEDNILLSVGDHQSQLIHDLLNVRRSIRISFNVYSDFEDIFRFVNTLKLFITSQKK